MHSATSGIREYGLGSGLCGYFNAEARRVEPDTERDQNQYKLSERIDKLLTQAPHGESTVEWVLNNLDRKGTGTSREAAQHAIRMAVQCRAQLQAVA